MNEDLLKKLIGMKLQAGAYILKEMPQPIQTAARTILEILHEELQTHLQNTQAPPQPEKAKTELSTITIE
jgi:hypothetical protein